MATKKNITPTSSPGFLKPIKSLLDNIKNVWGYFMTVVAIGTFVWTLGVKSERKSVDTANLKNAVESLKENSKKIDTLIIIINDIKSSQANLVEGQNSLRDSYVKYLVNDPKLTKKDFIVQPFKASGNGGQKRNKTMSACRIIHPASGAVAEAKEERSFFQNRANAFERLVEKPEFKKWHKIQCAKALGQYIDIEKWVEEQMDLKNLKIEIQKDGKWVKIDNIPENYDDLEEE